MAKRAIRINIVYTYLLLKLTKENEKKTIHSCDLYYNENSRIITLFIIIIKKITHYVVCTMFLAVLTH